MKSASARPPAELGVKNACRAIIKAASLALVLSLGGCGSQGSSDPLPVDDYQQNPRNFTGNRYELAAEIVSQLAYEADKGRLMVVSPAESEAELVVFVPADFDDSLYTGQRYRFDLRVDPQGLLWTEALRKF